MQSAHGRKVQDALVVIRAEGDLVALGVSDGVLLDAPTKPAEVVLVGFNRDDPPGRPHDRGGKHRKITFVRSDIDEGGAWFEELS